jgi:hypothetical protein
VLTDEQLSANDELVELWNWVKRRRAELQGFVATGRHSIELAVQGVDPKVEAWERELHSEEFWREWTTGAEQVVAHFEHELHRYTKRSEPPFALRKRWSLTVMPHGHNERAVFLATELLIRYIRLDPAGHQLDTPNGQETSDRRARAWDGRNAHSRRPCATRHRPPGA